MSHKVTVTPSELASLRSSLLNTTGRTPLHERFRSLFMLKAVGGDQVISIIAEGLESDPSPLLKHELAYVLGQLHDPTAIPILESVLVNAQGKHCSMVRHEAAEALGAISAESSLPLLRKYLNDPAREVRETCEVAIGKIEFDHSEEGLKRIPKAMFALRDYGGASRDAVRALAEGFNDPSALFRHEIAYIFGQLSSPHSIPSLLRVLRNVNEEDMVRHEAAEALGGIASDGADDDLSPEDEPLPTGGVLAILREWAVKKDAPEVVRESCQVAIDMWEYENSTTQFNPLDSVKENTTGLERSAAAALQAAV